MDYPEKVLAEIHLVAMDTPMAGKAVAMRRLSCFCGKNTKHKRSY